MVGPSLDAFQKRVIRALPVEVVALHIARAAVLRGPYGSVVVKYGRIHVICQHVIVGVYRGFIACLLYPVAERQNYVVIKRSVGKIARVYRLLQPAAVIDLKVYDQRHVYVIRLDKGQQIICLLYRLFFVQGLRVEVSARHYARAVRLLHVVPEIGVLVQFAALRAPKTRADESKVGLAGLDLLPVDLSLVLRHVYPVHYDAVLEAYRVRQALIRKVHLGNAAQK